LIENQSSKNSEEVDIELDSALREILDITQPATDLGPDINADIASSLTRLYIPESAKKLIEKVKDNYKIPQNCQAMGAPKVNAEIWQNLPQKAKSRDLSYQQQQQTLAIASVAVAKVAKIIYSAKSSMDSSTQTSILKQTLDASSALAMLHDDLNKKRKADIKPFMNQDIASICSTSITSKRATIRSKSLRAT
jgi:hypothetical protein